MSKEVAEQIKVLRFNCLKEKIGISRSSVYNKMNPNSKYYDEEFPKPIRLGESTVGWRESDVDAWLGSRPRAVGRKKSENF
ncbi:helix-turn-helix transcriptional regulator [Burkholderia gladioli]|uniref:helix-turn-helix transcriptional regulator n=1 Tax=Burkholderia gladioli TaxID=28095 RepID=UPI000F80CA2C|nr:AlpA family phage regulatory protein [Burkholderia gladioli]